MDELKPCAHCEHFAIDAGKIDKKGTFEICCSYCGSMMRGMDHAQLVEDWNRRPAPENKPNVAETICAVTGLPCGYCTPCCGSRRIKKADGAGLHIKYNVSKVEDGSVVHDCFVLRPDKDPAAITALQAYAEATGNKVLAANIYGWVGKPENKPLTLEQLRQMDGKPVWCSGKTRFGIPFEGWKVLTKNSLNPDAVSFTDNSDFLVTRYGEQLLAYARKPEEPEL